MNPPTDRERPALSGEQLWDAILSEQRADDHFFGVTSWSRLSADERSLYNRVAKRLASPKPALSEGDRALVERLRYWANPATIDGILHDEAATALEHLAGERAVE